MCRRCQADSPDDLLRSGRAGPGEERSAGDATGFAGACGGLPLGDVQGDFAGYTLTRGGERHGLSRKELEILRFLLAHEGLVLERSRILDAVWGTEEFPSTRTIDMHVLKLRRKLEPDPEAPRHLLTVHGVGYKFVR